MENATTQFPTSGRPELLETIDGIDSHGEKDEFVGFRCEPWLWRGAKAVKNKYGCNKSLLLKASVIVGIKEIRQEVGGELLDEFVELETAFMELDDMCSRHPVTQNDVRRALQSDKFRKDYMIGDGLQEMLGVNVPRSIKGETFENFCDVIGFSMSGITRVFVSAALARCELVRDREREKCRRTVEMFLSDYNEARLVLERAAFSYISTNAMLWVENGISAEAVKVLEQISENMVHIGEFQQRQTEKCIEAVKKNDSMVL